MSERGRVLVADDSAFFRAMLVHALGEDGYQVTAVADGAEALTALREQPGDFVLVIADLLMPEMNGFQLLEKLRREPGLEQLPVVVLTQYQLNELERGILKHHGANALPKSASLEQILFCLAATLNPEDSDVRRSQRLPVTLPVIVQHADKVHSTQCFNLSEEGMFVILPSSEAPTAGSDVELRFWIPGAKEVLELKGRVVWVNSPESMHRSHPPGFGAQLLDLDDGQRAVLRDYIALQG